MRIASERAASPAPTYLTTTPLPRLVGTSNGELAAALIDGGWLRRERYLEMKHLDQAWMVGFYLRALALRVVVRGH